jgi:hypothetical protein
VSRRGLHHNRSQQPSVVLDGVTGHSRSLRNCQGFGSAQITPEPLKGTPIETRIERLVDGKTCLPTSEYFGVPFSTFPPRSRTQKYGAKPVRARASRAIVSFGTPSGFMAPPPTMTVLHSVSVLCTSCRRSLVPAVPPKILREPLLCCASVSQDAVRHGAFPVGGNVLSHRQTA